MPPMMTTPNSSKMYFCSFLLPQGWIPLDPKLDQSSGTDSSHIQSRKKLLQYIKDLNLCDPWRRLNSEKLEFCFYSGFKTYSRIDYFLISNSMFSDSSILLSSCKFSQMEIPPQMTFRFQFSVFLEAQTDIFFPTNTDVTQLLSDGRPLRRTSGG